VYVGREVLTKLLFGSPIRLVACAQVENLKTASSRLMDLLIKFKY